jgi:arylsulfatase A-like enzyme
LLLAVALGLCSGYLDLVLLTLKKHWWGDLRYFGSGRDFPWTIPVAHVVLLFIPGLLLAVVSRLRPGLISLRAGAWLLATLAIWFAALRAPIHGAAALILGAGLGRPISAAVVGGLGGRPRRARLIVFGLLGLLIVLAVLSSGRQALRERRAAVSLPTPRAGVRNVVFIVWDTVRASSLSLYDYPRDTTPNLVRWAQSGVRFRLSLAPAPWTFPSHSCLFTGQWPHQLNSDRTDTLDTPDQTLAEYLAGLSYETVGFAANTRYCSYETLLNRGFARYEDYPLTPWFLLTRTVPGSWILQNVVAGGDPYAQKWIGLQARDARGITDAFLAWLGRRAPNRPFFAFLNYFDAHDPYVPPPEFVGRFGIRPQSRRDFQFLLDFAHTTTGRSLRDVVMARDCYDDCIAFLDNQLGRLLDELQGRALLDHTLVIVTSDHGESLGTHGIFGHGGSLYLDEVAVPLVILSPDSPRGRVESAPVSLRDLPATIIDQLGFSSGSPFPGHSLAPAWRSSSALSSQETSEAFSQTAYPRAFDPQPHGGGNPQGFQMSLVGMGQHYVRDASGAEHLYDLMRDPFEMVNLVGSADGDRSVGAFRAKLLTLLSAYRGAPVTEKAYLTPFRQWLQSRVDKSRPPPEATSGPDVRFKP